MLLLGPLEERAAAAGRPVRSKEDGEAARSAMKIAKDTHRVIGKVEHVQELQLRRAKQGSCVVVDARICVFLVDNDGEVYRCRLCCCCGCGRCLDNDNDGV